MADKKEKLSESDVKLLLAQMAQALANTPGTMAGAQTAFEGARNTAASEYQEKVAKEQEKAKKGGVLGTLGQIGGMALGNTLLPGVGGVLGAGLGGVAGHAAAGEQIDPMAAVFNMGLNAAAQYGLPKAQEAISNVTNPGDWSRVDRTAQTSARQIRGPEAPAPEDAPLVPSPAPAPAPRQAQPYQAPEYQFGGTATAGTMPGQQVQGGQPWTNMTPPQGRYVGQPPSGGPGSTVMPGLQMNVNDQGLSQSLPVPGAQQAQAPQQDFVSRLATNIAQAIQQVGLPQMSVVTPNNPRVPRALDAGTASAIRNEGVQQDFQRAQLANQTAQTQATTANTQLARENAVYQRGRDVTTDRIEQSRFDTTTGLAKDRITLEQQQNEAVAKSQAEMLQYRQDALNEDIRHNKVMENKPVGGGGNGDSLGWARFFAEQQEKESKLKPSIMENQDIWKQVLFASGWDGSPEVGKETMDIALRVGAQTEYYHGQGLVLPAAIQKARDEVLGGGTQGASKGVPTVTVGPGGIKLPPEFAEPSSH